MRMAGCNFTGNGANCVKGYKMHLHLKPGQKGTKQLLEKYGKALLCVRYRYDEAHCVRLKTVEITIEEKPLQPPFRFRDTDIVPVSVLFTEEVFRDKLKTSGGRWDPLTKSWLVPFGAVRGTELKTGFQRISSRTN